MACLVKQTGGDLLLSEETLFPQKKNCVARNATEEESDGSDIEDNVTSDEGFVDGSKEVPATSTSEDPLTFDEGAAAACLEEDDEAEDEEEDNEEESEEVNHIKL